MEFWQKLALFWIIVIGCGALIRRFPHHPISQLLLGWHGPVPHRGEAEFRFNYRWLAYAMKWFVAIAAVIGLGVFLIGGVYRDEPMWVTAIFAFALPMLAMLAAAGAIIFAVRGTFIFLVRRRSSFSEESGTFTPN